MIIPHRSQSQAQQKKIFVSPQNSQKKQYVKDYALKTYGVLLNDSEIDVNNNTATFWIPAQR